MEIRDNTMNIAEVNEEKVGGATTTPIWGINKNEPDDYSRPFPRWGLQGWWLIHHCS